MTARRGIAILGGTFDPVHNGHIACAEALYDALAVEQVLLIPSAQPPHRNEPHASAVERLAMLQLAVASHPHLSADDRELRREGKSFTVDTLTELRAEHPGVPIYFALGQDAFDKLHEWHRWSALSDYAHLVVLARPGYDDHIPAELDPWASPRLVGEPRCLASCTHGRIAFARVASVDVSATEIRAGCSVGKLPRSAIPDVVCDYIEANHLYS